jgi:DNA-binding MarR family transcriptional regulator
MAARRVTPRWLTADEQQVWRSYLDVYRLIDERLSRQLTEDCDLSMAEYEILVQLSEHPCRAMRMSELAERVVNSRSRLTHTVRRMEEGGLVTRRPCPDDGRGVLCELTDAGMARIVAAAPGHVEAVRRVLFDVVDADDLQHLGAALTKVREALRTG